MVANRILYVAAALLILGLGSRVGRDAVGPQQDAPAIAESKRDTLRRIYTAEIGVRETTGKNDGPRIAEYLRYCDLPEGYQWCAAYVSWSYGQAGYPEPRNPWSPALFPAAKTIWTKERGHIGGALGADGQGVSRESVIRYGDVFGIYNTSKKRIAHVGFVDGWDGSWCITVEGNVQNAVVRKRRPVSSIHRVARWAE